MVCEVEVNACVPLYVTVIVKVLVPLTALPVAVLPLGVSPVGPVIASPTLFASLSFTNPLTATVNVAVSSLYTYPSN